MRNPLKEKVKAGKSVIGTFVEIGHPDITEWLSRMGFDWILLDAEHGPLGFETMQNMMQSMNGTTCVPIVRPQWNDPVVIKRVLDIGAYGVLLPWVNTKQEAEAAVRACKYPPQGLRGYGPRRAAMLDPDYYRTANDQLLISVQIETQTALDNLDDILSVDGIDACYIGPYDLSCSLGFGIPPQWDNPKYLAAFDRVLTSAKRHEKAAGMFATFDNIEWALDKGFTYNTVDDADKFLVRGAQTALDKVHTWSERQRNANRLTFDQVWGQLKTLEGKVITTPVRRSRNRIVAFTQTGMLRQVWDESRHAWRDATEVPNSAFVNLWQDLSRGGDVEVKNSQTWRIAVACILEIPGLGVRKVAERPFALRLS